MKKSLISLLMLAFLCTGFLPNHNWQNKYLSERYIKKVMTKAAFWQLENPRCGHFGGFNDWTNATFYAGLFSLWETTGSKEIYQAIMDMGMQNNWKPASRLFSADDYAISQTYIDMYRIEKDEMMIKPTISQVDSFMSTPLEQPLHYKQEYPEIYGTYWWYADALFCGPPTLIKLGVTLADHKYLEFNDKLFLECYNMIYDKDESLFARDWKFKWTGSPDDLKETNGKKIFWSRGNGWVLAGLTRILQELPSDYPKRLFYENLFIEMSGRIVELQQPDGLWRASLLDPDSYPDGEASRSGFYCYALSWGVNNGLLSDKKYIQAARKAWIGLNGLVQKDGKVGWCQPVGGRPEHNVSEETWEVFGTGAFLLAGSEIIKMTLFSQ